MYTKFMNFVVPRPMVLVSLCFTLGIIIQINLNLHVGLLGLLSVILIGWALTQRSPGMVFFLLLIILSGCFRVAIDELIPATHLSKFIAEPDTIYQVGAVVKDIGQTKRGTPKYLLQPYIIQGQNITKGEMILYAKEMPSTLEPGDTLLTAMRINTPRGKRNPHEFDYRHYLTAKHIYFEAFLENPKNVTIYPCRKSSIPLWMLTVKQLISHHFHKYLTPRSAGILSALILGEKGEIEDSTRNDFANTGVIHVLAVSGLHVGYVTVILITIFGLFRFPHPMKMAAVMVGLLFYVELTGAAPSVMRASIMAALMILGGLLERKSDILNILASAAFIIVIISPEQLQNLGFQLSFLAVLSIVTLFPVLKQWTNSLPLNRSRSPGKLLVPLVDLFLVSLAAQVGTLAITIFYFHKIPIISLFANLIVVPLIGMIVATGMSFLILGSILPFLAPFWAATLEATIDLMLWFIQHCAQFNWAYVSTRSIHYYELILLLLGVFSVVILHFRTVLKLWVGLLLLWMTIYTWQGLFTPQLLELVMLDVGQGDAILVHTPNGKTMLIDTGLRFGGKDMGKDVIVPYLKYRNWPKIDLLVLTHAHNDHIGGAQYLIENMPVTKVIMPEVEYDSYGYMRLRESISSKNLPVSAVFAGYIDSTLTPIYFRVTGPKWYDSTSQPPNINNTSIIMQLFYGETSVMFTGDGEVAVENNELPLGTLLKSDIIKTPHHGSKTSSSQNYLNLVQPDICLISVGEKNKFRHPAPVTLQRYQNMGVKIHRTDREGAIKYTSDGKQWSRCDWK